MYIIGTAHCLNEYYQPDYDFMPGHEYTDVDEFVKCALSALDDFPEEPDCAEVAKKLRANDYTVEEVEPGYFEVHVEFYQ